MEKFGHMEDWQTNSDHYRDIFWKTMDEWADPSRADEGAVFIENVPNHEEMLAECQRYTSWNPESAYPLVAEEKDMRDIGTQHLISTRRNQKTG